MEITRRRSALAGTAAFFVVVALAGCQGSVGAAGQSVTQTQQAVPAATIAVNVPEGATDVRPDTTVTVASTRGTIDKVHVTAADGSSVAGKLSADKTSWKSDGPLALDTAYTVKSSAANAEGDKTPLDSTFTTIKPRATETASITPSASQGVVGVAMPIVVLFHQAPVDKAAAERKLTVTSTPAVEGSWHWMSSKQVVYRPKDFWTTGTKVDVTADMTGVEFAKNTWGVNRAPVHFEIGRNQVSTVDIRAHRLTVQQDGQTVRTIPVTTGMGTGKYATRNGTKVIITKESSHRMTAPGVAQDDPEYYNLVVRYAMRLTWSGEFIHAAPWSVGSQGRANVSHGCTGMSTANAQWMMANSMIGDPVNYVNGVRSLAIDNGWAFWNMPYDQWVQGSALYTPPAPAAPAAPAAAATASPNA